MGDRAAVIPQFFFYEHQMVDQRNRWDVVFDVTVVRTGSFRMPLTDKVVRVPRPGLVPGPGTTIDIIIIGNLPAAQTRPLYLTLYLSVEMI